MIQKVSLKSLEDLITMHIINFVPAFTIIVFLNACISDDRSILAMAEDEFLDCASLEAEMDLAEDMGDHAPARRKHIRSLQKQNQCISKPNISMSFSYTKFF